MSRILLICICALFSLNLGAQTPTCGNTVNAGIDLNGESEIFLPGIITNWDGGPYDIALENKFGAQFQTFPAYTEDSLVITNACAFGVIGDSVRVSVSNSEGSCWFKVAFKFEDVIVQGQTYVISCKDQPESPTPTAMTPCGAISDPTFIVDWIDADFDCDSDTAKILYKEYEVFDKNGNRGSGFDTFIVYKLPEISPANTSCTEKDTLYHGKNDRPVTLDEDDPLFGYYYIGPYTIVPWDPTMPDGACDTIWYCAYKDGEIISLYEEDNKCGLFVHKEIKEVEDGCEKIFKVKLELKQTCFGPTLQNAAACPPEFPISDANELAPGYWQCDIWVVDSDTLEPYAECKYDRFQEVKDYGNCEVAIVPTSDNECAAHTYLPSLCVKDKARDIKQVKAIIDGVGTFVLTPGTEVCTFTSGPFADETGTCYESHELVKLPHTDCPIPIRYEIVDECHLIYEQYCYIQVKDLTKPVAQSEKGLTVNLSNKKVWVDALSFDENSDDNCAINFILARRTDWETACVDLCYNVAYDAVDCRHPEEDEIESALFPVWSDGHDTLWCLDLDNRENCDEVETYYYRQLEWLCTDDVPCGEKVYNAWQYDLIKYATLVCKDNPHLDEHSFDQLFRRALKYSGVSSKAITHGVNATIDTLFSKFKCEFKEQTCPDLCANGLSGSVNGAGFCGYLDDEYDQIIDDWREIGGGWAEKVVFDCEDVCEPVTVEILVMDFWCNYSKAWTTVWVEDKSVPKVVQELDDVDITCASYRKHGEYIFKGQPVSIEDIVDAAAYDGDADAEALLTEIFGGYIKAWRDEHGNYVDADWQPIDDEIEFVNIDRCEIDDEEVWKTFKNPHTGEKYTYFYDSTFLVYVDETIDITQGIIETNCSANCEVTTWKDLDHCGEGYLYRKFVIYNGCTYDENASHAPDTVVRYQKIWIGNNCEIVKEMFHVPGDIEIEYCGDIQYGDDTNVDFAAMGFEVGYPEYIFDDDCRIVGIGHEDKVLKIEGGDEGCYKVLRTFYFMDWCTVGKPSEINWFSNEVYTSQAMFSCTQKIIIKDTIPPVCTIEGEAEKEALNADCTVDYPFTVSAEDFDCQVELEYTYEVFLRDKGDPAGTFSLLVASGFGMIGQEEVLSRLPQGEYMLKVVTTDLCNNEGKCFHEFDILSRKKPTPVCITSLTVELTPMDLDADGVIDTAMSTIWANEFNSSSFASCDIEIQEFRIELIDGEGDDDPSDDEQMLTVGCENAVMGENLVRVWVIGDNGAYDFCDVILIVQNNMGGCPGTTVSTGRITGLIRTDLGDPVVDATVTAELASGASIDAVSDIDGNYNLVTGTGNVNLTVSKDHDPVNGVTTLDLIEIQRHILGISSLDAEVQQIAADVNIDGRISTLDLLEIRSLILGIIPNYSAVNSWEFFNGNMESNVSLDVSELVTQNWMAVKMGDATRDADASTSRNNNGLKLHTTDLALDKGSTYVLDITSSNFDAYAGFQGSFIVDNNSVKIVDVLTESGELANLAYNITSNAVHTQWMEAEANTVGYEENAVLFSIVVEALENAQLSDVITIGNAHVPSMAVAENDNVVDVNLSFTTAGEQKVFALYQNMPNPFDAETSIQFALPYAGDATISIYDMSGKLLFQQENYFEAGVHQLRLNRNDLGASGVLYYQLDTEKHSASKRMVILETE